MSRTVTLVLVDPGGEVLGALAPFEVELPYWPDVTEVAAIARERFGVDVAVLRLLRAERPVPHGGAVTYLAEVTLKGRAYPPVELTSNLVALARDDEALARGDHARRAEYARPGGPAASLRWAADALAALSRGPVLGPVQQRTWNLSAIWLLPIPGGRVWLKQVPRFFSHEASVIRLVSAHVGKDLVPTVLAADDGRILMEDIHGADLYGADLDVRAAIAADMHAIQLGFVSRVDELIDAGVPDRRTSTLAGQLTDVVRRHGNGDPRLESLCDGLPERLAAIDACGIADTLVHGDLHPGNVRGGDGTRIIIDWGDSFVGHPGFDILRLCEGLPVAQADTMRRSWEARWRDLPPGSDPARALQLLAPVACLRNAAVYAGFLDQIEPAEHPYHVADVPLWLDEAAKMA